MSGGSWATTGMPMREGRGARQGARVSGAVLPLPLRLPLGEGFLLVSFCLREVSVVRWRSGTAKTSPWSFPWRNCVSLRSYPGSRRERCPAQCAA